MARGNGEEQADGDAGQGLRVQEKPWGSQRGKG